MICKTQRFFLNVIIFFSIFFLLGALSACGQKGPLYLVDPSKKPPQRVGGRSLSTPQPVQLQADSEPQSKPVPENTSSIPKTES